MKALLCLRQFPYSEGTLNFTRLLSHYEAPTLTMLTVVDNQADRSQAEEYLRNAQQRFDFEVGIKVRQGSALTEILQESEEGDYDLIVIGARDLHGVLDALLGSLTKLTSKVADKAKSSVLVVKEGRLPLNKILIAVGGQKMKRRVVKAGARLAKASGAHVTVFSVRDPVPTMYTGLEAIEETLEELLQTHTPLARHMRWSARYLAKEEIRAELKISQGVPQDEIIREARQGDYDMLVIGARSLSGPLQRLLINPVTPQVVERVQRSVLVVR